MFCIEINSSSLTTAFLSGTSDEKFAGVLFKDEKDESTAKIIESRCHNVPGTDAVRQYSNTKYENRGDDFKEEEICITRFEPEDFAKLIVRSGFRTDGNSEIILLSCGSAGTKQNIV